MINKTFRIPVDLAQHMDELGIPPNDIVIQALRQFFGLPLEESIVFMQQIHAWVVEQFSGQDFDEDVTLKTFRHIKEDNNLFNAYQRIVKMQEENTLHRRIGKMVKVALKAEVIGRSLQLDPAKELIKTYALLRRSTK